MRLVIVWNIICFLSLIPHNAFATVLAIDYGTEWIKASLLKPGIPFDVMLNKDSKRKMQSSVAWKRNERLFGSDAANLASRFPSDTFSAVKYLQGAPYQSESVSFYEKISSSDPIETERKTVGFKQSDGTQWSVEELIAMQFSYIRQLAESLGGEKVRDVVVTVPPYYSQYERDAVVDAIEIAGLRTLALINDGTAVAINFAMTRTFTTPEYHIIYDAGAASTVATVVAFAPIDVKKESAGTHITVTGVGYDRKAGGIELDRRMRKILVEMFNTKTKKDIREDKKGMAKLWKEARRVREILSANTEAISTVESLAWDIDFRGKVSRSTFENACGDMKDRFIQPIHEAVNAAGLSLNNITSIVLVGGSSRTPMVQAAIKEVVGADKIAFNVDADEASVFGAAFHAASLSRQFKTKNIKVTDISLHDVQATYFAASSGSASRPRSITSVVFPAGSKVGTKKTMTFKRKEDFTIHLDYKHLVASGFPQQMLEVDLVGVTDAIANLTERGAVDPVVKATVTLSESGFISVTDAIAYGVIKDDSITGKLKEFFGGASSSSGEATDSVENIPPRDTETPSSSPSSSGAAPSSSPSVEPTPNKKIVDKQDTISLNITVRFPVIPPMTAEGKRSARSRLRVLDNEEAARNKKDEARNTLEGYLYRMRDLLDDNNHDTPFRKCSKESERQTINELLEGTFTWLHDNGDAAETSQFLDRRISLESLEKPIIHRYKEIEVFPQALNNSQMWNWNTRLFLTEARQNLTAEQEADLPSKWTKEELDSLEKTLKEHETWLHKWVEKQKTVKSNEDPVIETTEMKARAKVLETQLMKLWKRKVPKAVKKTKTTSSVAPVETSAEEGETTDEPVPPQEEPTPEAETGGSQDETQKPLKGPEHDEL